MARPGIEPPRLDLFPFLSVLAAVMGTLILIIAGYAKLALVHPGQRMELEPNRPDRKIPIYIECRAEGIAIYPQDPTSGEPTLIWRDELTRAENPWLAFARQLERRPSDYLMLLVRPDGVATFHQVLASVNGTAIDVGYEPVFGPGPVRFRHRSPRREER